MINFLHLGSGLPAAELVEEIEAHPELWDAHRARKDTPGSPHSRMSDIWVRYNALDHLGPQFNDEHVPVNYPAWDLLPTARRICFQIMANEMGQMLGGVLITRIPPGGRIEPHTDAGWHVDYYDKFYVALKSPEGSVFGSDRWPEESELLTPAVGDLHRFDNRNRHWVTNNSNEDKMTLIVCVRTDKYR